MSNNKIKIVSLRKKIINTAIVVIMVVGILLVIVAGYLITTTVIANFESYAKSIISQMGIRIELLIESCNKNADLLTESQLLINYMKNLKNGTGNYNIIKYNIIRYMINQADLDNIDGIYIYPSNNSQQVINCYYTSPQLYGENIEFDDLEKIIGDNGTIWVTEKSYPYQLCRYSKISSGNTVLGYMQIKYKSEIFQDILNSENINMEGEFYVIDSNNKILASSNLEMVDTSLPENFQDNHLQNVKYDLDEESWQLIGQLPQSHVFSQIELISIVLIIMFICITIAVITFTLLTFRYIQQPLERISYGIKSLQKGDLNVELQNSNVEEFQNIINNFNHMTTRIKKQMETIYQQQENYRKAEIAALQGKLDPHFLYNVLDTVYWRSIMKNDEPTGEIIVALSNILRYSISHGDSTVSLSEDLEHTKNYLKIQQILLDNRIDVYFKVDPIALKCQVPKLMIQPIIENAIKHGIGAETKILHLSIVGTVKGNNILFEICDDGPGISKKTLKQISEKMNNNHDDDKEKYGIGLRIVHKRLQYLYGDEYGVTIKSHEGMGTCVNILLKSLDEH